MTIFCPLQRHTVTVEARAENMWALPHAKNIFSYAGRNMLVMGMAARGLLFTPARSRMYFLIDLNVKVI
jgi:hypothetical protein